MPNTECGNTVEVQVHYIYTSSHAHVNVMFMASIGLIIIHHFILVFQTWKQTWCDRERKANKGKNWVLTRHKTFDLASKCLIWATNLCFDLRITEDGRGHERIVRENCTLSRENVLPNNNVVVNPYRINKNAGRVEHATTLRNPYKRNGATNGTQITLHKHIMANTKVRSNRLYCTYMFYHYFV